jgi:hypothetical protein
LNIVITILRIYICIICDICKIYIDITQVQEFKITDGEMKKEYAIQFLLHDFIQEKQLEHVTSIRKYVGYHDKLLEDGTSYHGDVSFRRWSLYHDSNYTSNNPWEHNTVCTPFL